MIKNLLTIAGSDSSGGAGIQADLKTFAAFGTYGMSVITAVTAQNTQGVTVVQDIEPGVIDAQIKAVFDDIRVDGVKIGMLSVPETISVVARGLQRYQPKIVVLDPVMVSKSGCHLLQPTAKRALVQELLPLVTVVTPNIPEAEEITGYSINNKADMIDAAKKINSIGACCVLLKGGHLDGQPDDLLYDGKQCLWFTGRRIISKNTHGTGCTLSSALTVNLAKGVPLEQAVQRAKEYVKIAIEHGLDIGSGCGPTHHFVELYRKAGIEE